MSALDETDFSAPPAAYQTPSPAPSLGANIAKLESDLATERDLRCEERFIWISVCFVFCMSLVYTALQSFLPFFLLFLFGLVVLIGVAERLGVDWAVRSVGWLLHWASAKFQSQNDQ